MTDESWRSPGFRHSIVTKIEEAVRQSGMSTSRYHLAIEDYFYEKAETREKYLGSVANLIGLNPNNVGDIRMLQQLNASPALVPSPGTPMGMGMGSRPQSMAPSPSGSLNTPGQSGQSPMGGGSMTDEQAYRDKVRQLSKYIEPLRKMIAKMGNDDVGKITKMKNLLEILSNPQKRMPLDTLIKCEIVLEKIDFKRCDGSVNATSTPHLPFKEPHDLDY